MTTAEVHELLRVLAHFFPGRFDPPEPTRRLWEADLAPYDPALALECLKEWVRWHGDYPPELGEFDARCRTAAARCARKAREAPAPPATLHPDHATLTQLQVRLLARRVWPWDDEDGVTHARLTPEECAAQCAAWAEANVHRPRLAEDLRVIAAHWRRAAAVEGNASATL